MDDWFHSQIIEVNFTHRMLWPFVLCVFVGIVMLVLISFCCCCCVSGKSITGDVEGHLTNWEPSPDHVGITWTKRPRPPPLRRSRSITPLDKWLFIKMVNVQSCEFSKKNPIKIDTQRYYIKHLLKSSNNFCICNGSNE